ncbi:G-type lectin S-receptor-like serine/threonine-protein kinase LECRK2, partial [Prunus avium]|uniref:G-type lectin S-receptor-like serine/threonine-protein kinase LECRK2 n=1 Tax=Prunus avium TaxID=42229 RepID=A0A6P5RNG8_PRUAV
DTILPTQTLNQNSNLYARYTATNYSSGRFLFALQSDGNLVLYTTNFPQDTANSAYWATNTNIGFQVIFNQSGLIYLVSKNGSVLEPILSHSHPTSIQNYYQRATLEDDGVLRHYVHPKSGSIAESMAWSTAVSIPPNICLIAEQMGGGACGINSLCRLGNEGRPICECPRGYTLIDPNDVRKGCKQNFVPQSCDQASPKHLFDFEDMQNTNFVFADYEHFTEVTEDWCRQNCLDDCFCAVAIVNSKADCFKKRLPFSNGRIYPGNDAKALIKYGKDNSTFWRGGGAITKKKHNSTLILVVSLLMSSSGVLNILLPLITYLVVSRVYSRKAKVLQPRPVLSGMNLKDFTYEELKKATNEFKEELGRGASATVFKGVLVSDTGMCVAVKRLDAKVRENDLEFEAEVSAISRRNH